MNGAAGEGTLAAVAGGAGTRGEEGYGPAEAAGVVVGALVQELVRAGVRQACVCPGSRSTPLALSLARTPGIRVWTHVDERAAGFFALGLARARGEPVILVSTSGTAAANFYPAVIEARYGRVPLVVLTADRPHELRECGAPQAIDQIRLYGSHVKLFLDLPVPDLSPHLQRYVRSVAARVAAAAAAPPAGPVHLNLPFREPLVPRDPPSPPPDPRPPGPPLAAGPQPPPPYTRVTAGVPCLPPAEVQRLAARLRSARQGLIVCGPAAEPGLPGAVSTLARATGWPILADPLSGLRCGPHDRSHVVVTYDTLLRDRAFARALTPDLVLRFGPAPTSKALGAYLEEHAGVPQLVVDGGGGWPDPASLAAEVLHADGAELARALAAALGGPPAGEAGAGPGGGGPGRWLAAWLRADAVARSAMAAAMDRFPPFFEGRVFWELAELLPAGSTLFVGNSMPVRDLDSFFPGSGRAVRLLGNRGANGIDGLVSSALGAAAAATGGPLVAVMGDLSFYHDLNGLLAARLHGLAATLVVINNDGGGIFSFLPQAAEVGPLFEALFATPLGLDFRPAVEMYGGRLRRPGDWEEFRQAVAEGLSGNGLQVVEVPSDRQRNVALHQAVWGAVMRALEPLLSEFSERRP